MFQGQNTRLYRWHGEYVLSFGISKIDSWVIVKEKTLWHLASSHAHLPHLVFLLAQLCHKALQYLSGLQGDLSHSAGRPIAQFPQGREEVVSNFSLHSVFKLKDYAIILPEMCLYFLGITQGSSPQSTRRNMVSRQTQALEALHQANPKTPLYKAHCAAAVQPSVPALNSGHSESLCSFIWCLPLGWFSCFPETQNLFPF